MLRTISAAAAVAAAAASSCTVDELAAGAVTCDAAEPAWVKMFSTAAAGPEQVFLNMGRLASDMVVGWANAVEEQDGAFVEWGVESGRYSGSARATTAQYVYGKYTSPFLQHATMVGLAPKTRHYYRVGTNSSWSPEYSFMSNAVGADQFPYVLGHLADVGESSNAAQTIAQLLLSTKADNILLAGDMSYASGCEKNGCTTWDAFQRMLEPLSATVPISVELGNRE